ncbi:MAG: hypothetical protein B6245_01090 [Desulfobacteraceae bacterium 4572_88]|nr:MAG: hypothetical protein B6245_01090 [Desulfobacteraceae bacterium 4572_88]
MGGDMKDGRDALKEAIRTYHDLREICSASRETALRSPNSPVAGKIFSTDRKIRKRDKRDVINEPGYSQKSLRDSMRKRWDTPELMSETAKKRSPAQIAVVGNCRLILALRINV